MDFADFDDDLFEEKPSRVTVAEEYQARQCEEGWFMRIEPEKLVSQEDESNVQKFAAEYLFFCKSYKAAAAKYEEILKKLPENNTNTRRECEESLARCHIKMGTPDMAIAHAEKLHSTSKTVDHFTVSYSVLFDVYLAANRYDEALMAAQNLVSLHSDNSLVWMKLSLIYALLNKINLPNIQELIRAHLPVPSETIPCINSSPSSELLRCQKIMPENGDNLVTETENQDIHESELPKVQVDCEEKKINRDVMIVAACLQRAYYIIVKTEGTSVGFSVSYTKIIKDKIFKDLKSLLDDCSLKELRKNVHQNDKVEVNACSSESDFSYENMRKRRTKDEDEEVCVSQDNFEEKWFKWIS